MIIFLVSLPVPLILFVSAWSPVSVVVSLVLSHFTWLSACSVFSGMAVTLHGFVSESKASMDSTTSED